MLPVARVDLHGPLPPQHPRVRPTPGRTGGFGVFHRRGEENHTFAIALQRAGYLTAMMGKYLNGYLQGPASTRSGGRRAAQVRAARLERVGRGRLGLPGVQLQPEPERHASTTSATSPQDYLTDVLARRGVQFIHATVRSPPAVLPGARHVRPAHAVRARAAGRARLPGPAGAPPAQLRRAADQRAAVAGRPSPAHGAARSTEIDHAFRRRAQSVQAVDRMIGRGRAGALRATGQARQHLHRLQLRQRPAHRASTG